MEEQQLIKWDDRLLTDMPTIDAQHKYFIGLLNDLYKKFEQMAPSEEFNNDLSKLIAYKATHFATEEGFMKKYNFSGLEEHAQIHRKMSADLDQFVIRYKNEGKKVLPEIFDFLENWLVQHLELYDNKYAEYFRKIGVSE